MEAIGKCEVCGGKIIQAGNGNIFCEDCADKNFGKKLKDTQGNGVLPCVSGGFIADVEKLTNDIIKYFPKFFDNFTNFEYGTGVDAGKDFKKIFNRAKRLNKTVSKNYR